MPAQQRKEKLAARQENQRLIDEAVSEWYSYTLAKADDLGKQFNKKPRYFLDIFFQGGAKMVTHHQKTNAYNAFKSLKAAGLNEGFYSTVHFGDILMCSSFRRGTSKINNTSGRIPR
jgi:hypothetical protein